MILRKNKMSVQEMESKLDPIKEPKTITMEMSVEEAALLRFYLVVSTYSSNSCMEKAMDDILHKNHQSVAVKAVRMKNIIVKYLDTALAKEDAEQGE